MKAAKSDVVPEPAQVTGEQIRALSAKDPIYAAGVQIMIRRGLWKLKGEDSLQEAH